MATRRKRIVIYRAEQDPAVARSLGQELCPDGHYRDPGEYERILALQNDGYEVVECFEQLSPDDERAILDHVRNL